MSKWTVKLSSRKFWACLAGVAAGLVAVFGLDTSVIGEVSGMVTALASIVSYIWAEGLVDASRARQTTDTDWSEWDA